MEVLRPDQIIALVAFLVALGLLWVAVHRHKGGLSRRLNRGRRLQLSETAALGPADRAMILSVDGQDFLLVRLRGAAPILHALGPSPAAAMAGGAE